MIRLRSADLVALQVVLPILSTESVSWIDIDLIPLSFRFALTVQNEEPLQPSK
jgi:hypothetical protein